MLLSEGVGAGDIVTIIRDFGFPIFVACWFMLRLEKRLDKFTRALEDVTRTMVALLKTVEGLPPELPPANGREE